MNSFFLPYFQSVTNKQNKITTIIITTLTATNMIREKYCGTPIILSLLKCGVNRGNYLVTLKSKKECQYLKQC